MGVDGGGGKKGRKEGGRNTERGVHACGKIMTGIVLEAERRGSVEGDGDREGVDLERQGTRVASRRGADVPVAQQAEVTHR